MQNIIASHWAIAGNSFPGCGNEVSEHTFAARMEAAAKAGFRGAGFVHQDLVAQKALLGYREMTRILQANGIQDVEIEILSDWFSAGAKRSASDRVRSDLLEAAEALQAHHIKVAGDFFPKHEWPLEKMAAELASLSAQARRAGAKVGIEIMPFTNLSTLRNTMPLIRAAGDPNAGVLLDTWHMQRGGVDLNEIGDLPAGSIISAEINDALAEVENGDLLHDTLHNRLLPGEGCFEIPLFISELGRSGYAGPIGVEIISKVHRLRPLQEAAALSFESVRKFLQPAQARQATGE